MEIEEKSIKNMIMINAINWLIIMVIVKLFKPEYCYFRELIMAVLKKRELVSVFYVVLMTTYIITTYVLAIMSIYAIGYMTIGKGIRFVKALFNKKVLNMEQNLYNAREYSTSGIALIVIYTFLILPTMLYILWPALSVILIIVLILFAIISCG